MVLFIFDYFFSSDLITPSASRIAIADFYQNYPQSFSLHTHTCEIKNNRFEMVYSTYWFIFHNIELPIGFIAFSHSSRFLRKWEKKRWKTKIVHAFLVPSTFCFFNAIEIHFIFASWNGFQNHFHKCSFFLYKEDNPILLCFWA